MKALHLSVLIATVFSVSAEARLGESLEQCEARYGKSEPIKMHLQLPGEQEVITFLPPPVKLPVADASEVKSKELEPLPALRLRGAKENPPSSSAPAKEAMVEVETLFPINDPVLPIAGLNNGSFQAYRFFAKGLKIYVVLEDGAAVLIKYSKAPVLSIDLGTPPPTDLAADEITYLIGANAQGAPWRKLVDSFLVKNAPFMTVWESDGSFKFISGYNRAEKELFVCSPSFWDLVVGQVKVKYGESINVSVEERFIGL